MTNNSSHKKLEKEFKDKIKKILSVQLGIQPEDIEESDSFSEDLNMTPVDITDFIESLKSNGVELSDTKILNSTTIEEFLDEIASENIII